MARFSSKKDARQTRNDGYRAVFGLFKRQCCYRGTTGDSVLLSSPAGVTVSRASIIAHFLGTDSLAWLMSLAQGLVSFKTGILTGILCAPLLIGIHLENRLFTRSKEGAVRRKVLILLMG